MCAIEDCTSKRIIPLSVCEKHFGGSCGHCNKWFNYECTPTGATKFCSQVCLEKSSICYLFGCNNQRIENSSNYTCKMHDS